MMRRLFCSLLKLPYGRLLLLLCTVFGAVFMTVPQAQAATPQPSWTPVEQEYYPTDSRKYPEKIVNPHPQVRNVAFEGKPLDIFTKINMVSQIQLPEPPVMVNIGNPEAYVLDVSPDFASLFIKPITETDMTNLIVTTERGTYIFMLKENPYKPFDVLVRVGNPYKKQTATDEEVLVEMALSGQRHAAFQFEPMEIRTCDSSTLLYDAALGVGIKAELRRIVSLSKRNLSLYHVRFTNTAGRTARTQNYVVDEKSVQTNHLRAVAAMDGGTGFLRKDDSMDIFIFVNTASIPDTFGFRFSVQADRSLVFEAKLKTGKSNFIKPETNSVDERIQQMYHQVTNRTPVVFEEPKPSGGQGGGSPSPVGSGQGSSGDTGSSGIVIFKK